MAAKILLVEDEPAAVELLSAILAGGGYDRPLVAFTGPEGVDTARAELPDLVLLDVMLPGFDGLEVCRLLKSDPRTVNVHTCMLTALAQVTDVLKAMRAHADDYITKPFTSKAILDKAAQVLGPVRFAAGDPALLPDQTPVTVVRRVSLGSTGPAMPGYQIAERSGRLRVVPAGHLVSLR
ncbi:MAG: response regulator [SAR202 cluster bacterium]|nr:response regulator [SAR202 cluster bacterium]